MAILGNQPQALSPVDELLASLPTVGGRRIPTDGTQPGSSRGQPSDQQPGQDPGTDEQNPIGPTLEDADDQTAFRVIDQLGRSQDRLRRNRWAIDLYHGWLDDNIRFGRLQRNQAQGSWVAKLPPGITLEQSASVPNKSADLCNKVTDALLADPPKPNPQPHTDDEAVDAAADLMGEVLRQLAGEAGINEIQHYRWALRNALTRATSYLEYDIDPTGGGYQPYQILAHPQATDPQNPLVAIDPTTGQPTPSVDPILRYVSPPSPEAPAGLFVEDASQADRAWLPKLVVRRHKREKVTLFPATAGIEDADAVLIQDFCTLAEARKRWPDTVGKLGATELAGFASWRPPMAEVLVPFPFRSGMQDGATGPSVDEVGSLSPLLQRRMFFYRFIVRKSTEYPDGLQIDISGKDGGTSLARKTLEYNVTLPTQGSTTRCRDIQVVQVTPVQDVEGQDPTGWPFEARFDGSAQADASLIAGYLDFLDRMNNPHVFIPSTSSVDEDAWFDRTKPIPYLPSGGKPEYEQFPPLPPVVPVSEYLQTRQDTASGLTATAQGLDSSNSQSGIAKQLTVRQAQVSLAGMQQQLHGAMTRGWRICGQIIQAEYTTPQLIKFSGEDSSSQEQWWTGEDLSGIDDIGIEPGTGSLMTPESKANLVGFAQQQGWLPADRAAEIALGGMSRDLGLPPDMTKASIDRSIRLWHKGPPNPEWIQQYQAYAQQKAVFDQAQAAFQQATQQYQAAEHAKAVVAAGPAQPLGPEQQNEAANVDFQSARIALAENPQAAAGPPQPPQMQPPVAPWTPFEPRANDTEPKVAAAWMEALSRGMMHPRYSAQPVEWRAIYDEKYMKTRQAVALAAQPQAPQGNPPATGASQPTQPGHPKPPHGAHQVAPHPPAVHMPKTLGVE
jgi:hypothetical protein